MTTSRTLRFALLLLVAASLGQAERAGAQITIVAGSSANVTVAPNQSLTVPITLDMSAAGGGNVSAFTADISWNAGVLTIDSIGGAGFGTMISNITNGTSGLASISVTSAVGTTTSVQIANLFFTSTGSGGGTAVRLAATGVSNSLGMLSKGHVLLRNLDVCVAPTGLWGDVNASAAVDIIDAQQIARNAVGLSVLDQAALDMLGDVTGDVAINIIDAQQIARFSIALPAVARIATSRATPPVVASVAVGSVTTPNIGLRQTVVLHATPKDASGFSVAGCAPVSWASSNPAAAVVNSAGMVRSIGGGSAVITATSGSFSAQATVTVTAPDATAALTHLRNITAGGTASATTASGWQLSGLLTDEWKTSDTFSTREEVDRRTVLNANSELQGLLRELHRARLDASDAIPALIAASAPPSAIAQMYFIQGYAELQLAELFCNGVPIGNPSSGLLILGAPLTNAAVYARSIAHFDSALALASATDAFTVEIKQLSLIGKGRALLNQGQFATAAAAVSSVPTNFRGLSTLVAGENNRLWNFNASIKRLTVGDSVNAGATIPNALPFAAVGSTPDFRVSVTNTGLGKGFDGVTDLVRQNVWGQNDTTPIFLGLDARLIEAESHLVTGNFASMMAILNQLRATPQNIGPTATSPAPPLATPGSGAAATSLLFRERAFWTFGRGQRLGDLRRRIRLHGGAQGTLFPTGSFHTGGVYGSDVNFPASVDEEGNVLTTVCIDRNP